MIGLDVVVLVGTIGRCTFESVNVKRGEENSDG